MLIFKAIATYRKAYTTREAYDEDLKMLQSIGVEPVENNYFVDDEFFEDEGGYIYIDITEHYDHDERGVNTLQDIKALAYYTGEQIRNKAFYKIPNLDTWELVDCPISWQVINDN